MHYFIDGYNLLFRLARAGEGPLQLQREKMIEELGRKINALSIDATIVFDSHYQQGLRSRNSILNFEILFTDEGETADECILDELRRMPFSHEQMVVTSDKKLSWQARLKGAQTQTVEAFLAFLEQKWLRKRLLKSNHKPNPKPFADLPFVQGTVEYVDEYYLNVFETVLAEDPYYKRIKEEKERRLSDFDRWLEIFEQRLKEEDGA
ncbi:MAG: NYN domain-containing protein [Parachlamydiaceae bacterium]